MISNNQKQPRYPSNDEWIIKMWFTKTMECYSEAKKNEICSKWMELGKNE